MASRASGRLRSTPKASVLLWSCPELPTYADPPSSTPCQGVQSTRPTSAKSSARARLPFWRPPRMPEALKPAALKPLTT